MASKSPLDKLQETVVGTVRAVAKDPIGTAKGTFALGRAVAGQVAGQVTRTVKDRLGASTPPPSAPAPLREQAPPPPTPKPSDVARVVEKKPAPAKKAPPPRKKAPAKKSTPSAKLPPKKKAD